MSGRVHWLRELDEESYYLTTRSGIPPRRIVIERPAFESIGDYTNSQPTGPSPGRIYRKNLHLGTGTIDDWIIYICQEDPNDTGYVLHYPHVIELVEAGTA